ncbi:MAG: DegT/DnrJ/EryC1/StrS aminotransferase family protein [Dehalococcoidia bacterium]|nr:DegT/DnrJ/EryC1/StrS aminotransferase family protein [Dehalococcoidia bacterium]
MANDTAPTLAIDGGQPLRTEAWPTAPAVVATADPELARILEAEFAAGLGLTPDAVIALASAADARRIALRMAIAGRHELVLPVLCASPWVDAAQAAGLTVVAAEVDSDTAALAARGFSAVATDDTAAVVAVYPFGHPPLLDTLITVARERSCMLIEDCSEALGASYRGTAAGSVGGAAVFALGARHLLTGGVDAGTDGGAILVLRDSALVEQARSEAAAMADSVAAVALAEWRGREDALWARRELAWELTFNLRGMRGVASMPHGRWIRHAYDRYVFRLRGMLWKRTFEETLVALRAEGLPVEAALGASLAAEPSMTDDRTQAASRLPREMVALPLHAGLTSRDMDQAAAIVRKVEQWAL